MSHANHEHCTVFSVEGLQLGPLKQVSFALPEHGALGVVGPSGVGKTLLLKALAHLVEPETGAILFRGHNPQRFSKAQRAVFRRSLGMTFQRGGLFDSLSALENLTLPLTLGGMAAPGAETLARQALAEVGLQGAEDKRVSELSGGMQKRLGVARALLLNPEVILYDDPTAGLDPVTGGAIWKLLEEKKAQGRMTLVVVSSEFRALRRLCDRLLVLLPGGEWAQGTFSELEQQGQPAVRTFLRGRAGSPL